jgi:hypothetical protein
MVQMLRVQGFNAFRIQGGNYKPLLVHVKPFRGLELLVNSNSKSQIASPKFQHPLFNI